jgi:hypothetical protein
MTQQSPEAEIDLLGKEMPVVSHPLFGGISQAWAMKELADGADSDNDYRRLMGLGFLKNIADIISSWPTNSACPGQST